MVPLWSLRVGSSVVGVGVGTPTFTKRLMSNATVKSIPKIAAAITDQNCHQMVGAKVVIDQFHLSWFLRFYWFSCVNFGF